MSDPTEEKKEKMRLTIFLDEEQGKQLKHFAIDRGIGISEYVDWLLKRFIEKKSEHE